MMSSCAWVAHVRHTACSYAMQSIRLYSGKKLLLSHLCLIVRVQTPLRSWISICICLCEYILDVNIYVRLARFRECNSNLPTCNSASRRQFEYPTCHECGECCRYRYRSMLSETISNEYFPPDAFVLSKFRNDEIFTAKVREEWRGIRGYWVCLAHGLWDNSLLWLLFARQNEIPWRSDTLAILVWRVFLEENHKIGWFCIVRMAGASTEHNWARWWWLWCECVMA